MLLLPWKPKTGQTLLIVKIYGGEYLGNFGRREIKFLRAREKEVFWLDPSASWYLTVKSEGKEEVCPQPCLVKNKTQPHTASTCGRRTQCVEYVCIQLSLGEECIADQSIYSVHFPHN